MEILQAVETEMICIAYLSTAPAPPSPERLDQILEVSQRNNAARGVTGMLCHYDGSFLQFLEGEAEDVDAVFGTISQDPRHQGVIRLYRREITERLFGEWSMALVKPDAVSPQLRPFCQGLREVESAATPAHAELIAPFVDSFRTWIR